jgi:hypothetical protein
MCRGWNRFAITPSLTARLVSFRAASVVGEDGRISGQPIPIYLIRMPFQEGDGRWILGQTIPIHLVQVPFQERDGRRIEDNPSQSILSGWRSKRDGRRISGQSKPIYPVRWRSRGTAAGFPDKQLQLILSGWRSKRAPPPGYWITSSNSPGPGAVPGEGWPPDFGTILANSPCPGGVPTDPRPPD